VTTQANDAASVEVFHAQPIGNSPAGPLVISATFPIPEIGMKPSETTPEFMARAHRIYEEQATRIGEALLAHLPGGTIDALLVVLLKHKASIFVVPYGGAR